MLSIRNTTGLAALIFCATATATLAQEGPMGPGMGKGNGQGRGMMMGPGMMGKRGFGAMCTPRMAGFAEWRLRRIETMVKPNDAQKQKLDDLRATSIKAGEMISKACAAEVPAKSPERLALMEQRLETMLAAMKSVRPPFEAFYATLDEAQKAKLDAAGPRNWGWRKWR